MLPDSLRGVKGMLLVPILTIVSDMNIFLVILLIIAIALFITGGLLEAVGFLIWVAVALVVLAIIMWAVRAISGRSR